MTLKDKLATEPGFQYVIDNMELMSAPGRRRLLQQPFLKEADALQREYDNTERIRTLLRDEACSRAIGVVRHQLMQLHDLQGTLTNLQHQLTLEEIELFEIKHFAYLCMKTAAAADELGITPILAIPQTDAVFALLDPDGTGIDNFYVYDSYHPDLPELRKQLKAKQILLDNSHATVEENAPLQREVNDLFERQNRVQQEVVAQLSEQLLPWQPLLQDALERMAYADLLLARATLAEEWHLCRPTVDEGLRQSHYRALWNPRLKHRNEALHQRYQPLDIDIAPGVCLITGANMAGKTVLLKTVGIAQLLAQFGFHVPADEATTALVDDILFCIGDEQNEMNGLSSYASEIIKISDTVNRSADERLLILIDEPARTTNPVEGKAIVQAVATILDSRPSATLITTHYSQLGLGCRRLRVKGFVEDMADVPLTPENINRFMDYSLLPDESDDVPQEALRIATILKCNPLLTDTARKFL